MDWVQMVITIVCSVLASSGFWAFVQSKKDKDNAETKMLLGLAHDRILYLGTYYIERGYVTKEEFENLNDYLYTPYKELGGNGTAKKIMNEVDKLPVKAYKAGDEINESF